MAQWLRALPQKTCELEFGFHINTGYGHMCTCELTILAEKEKEEMCLRLVGCQPSFRLSNRIS